ncbi:hypothetical protein [Marinoscillum furvescens]|uniref:DUF748 domain-containing protein n=1 Tax=Marinoscillum furvescens DSM 4134 TaxID=1122208 RepID=A0A3D9L4S2_MARFU|nr:hypothetical protein [Marinoscillum furvescens]REE00519.1 hypothetical protein C7460_105142 [Marinoscillum furvescens DSM 4134]
MPPNKPIRNGLVITGIALLILGVTYIVTNYLAHQKFPKLFGDKVQVASLDLNLLKRSVRFRQPTLNLDTAQADTSVSIYSRAKEIYITGFSVWSLLFDHEVHVNNIVFDSLALEIKLPSERPTNQEREAINLFVKEVFTRIEVENFELKNAHIRAFHHGKASDFLRVSGLNIGARKIVVDTGTIDQLFPMAFEQSTITIDSTYLKLNENYTLTSGKLDVRDTALAIKSLHFKPIWSKEKFAEKHPYEKARIDFFVDSLHAQKLLWELHKNKRTELSSSKLHLHQPVLEVYKDKNPPQGPPHTKPLLSGLLHKIPLAFRCDTLTATDGFIAYEQYPVALPRSGRISFENLYVSAYHISNDTAYLQHQPTLTIDVLSQFMGVGKLTTQINLDMNSASQQFGVSGSLDEMPLSYVNQVLSPLVGVKAKGDLRSLDFDFKGDDYSSSGELFFQYENLNITVFDKERDEKWLQSILGNLVVRNENLPSESNYKTGNIYFIRYQNKDFFNYLWNSLRVGLMDIVVPFYTNPDKANPPEERKIKEDNH